MILDALIHRRAPELRQSPENPSMSLSDPGIWDFVYGGVGESKTGIRITPTKAMKVRAVWSCIRVRAETLGMLPLIVYERLAGGGRQRATTHPVYQLLHDRPNPELTPFLFKELLGYHLNTWGNAYFEIERNKGGAPIALWPLLPHRTQVKRMTIAGAKVKVLVTNLPPSGEQVVLQPESYLHIPGMGYNGLKGHSPIEHAREAIGLAAAAEEYGARFFLRGGHPTQVLTHGENLTDDGVNRLRQQFDQVHGGLSNAHRMMVLEKSMDIKAIGLPQQDAQFIETRKFQIADIAGFFRVPLHLINDLDKATFSNIEQQSLEFVVFHMGPELVRVEQSIAAATLEEAAHYCEFLVDALLRGDAKSRQEAFAIQRQNGVINADEWRERENMNAQPDGQGQTYLVPLNMVPADEVGMGQVGQGAQGQNALPAGDELEQRDLRPLTRSQLQVARGRHRLLGVFRKLFARFAQRVVNDETDALREALRDALQDPEPMIKLEHQMRRFWGGLTEISRKHLQPILEELALALAGDIGDELGQDLLEAGILPGRLERLIQSYVDAYASRHQARSEKQLLGAVEGSTQDSLEGDVTALAEQWQEERADAIANEEATRSGGAVSHAFYAHAGWAAIVWVAIGKSCGICNRLNGKRVHVKKTFAEPGDTIDPGDGETAPLEVQASMSHPPAHGGCDCVIIAG